MRLCVDRDDPGYRDDVFSGNWAVFLDGRKQQYVCCADEEKGEIVAILTLRGVVEIKRICPCCRGYRSAGGVVCKICAGSGHVERGDHG